MASLYAQYLSERSDDHIYETEKGFVTYRFINGGKTLYIVDIFVLPEFRQAKVAGDMADKVCSLAKEKGSIEVLGSVCPSAKGSTISLKVLLGYGMSLQSASDNFIVFRKEIQ